MKQYSVTGMSCAACQARVEKAVSQVDGVNSCAVSLLRNSMGIEGSADPSEVIKAVEKAGYGAKLKDENSSSSKVSTEDELADKETPVLKRRLFASLVFLVVLMYFSMGHMMLGLPIPSFFEGNHVAMGLIQLLLSGAVLIINQKFFVSGFKSLVHLSPNMDTLVALGSGVSFLYSTIILFLMTGAVIDGDKSAVMAYMNEFYFESAAMILALITVGKLLESISKGKTTSALKSLMKLSPKTATVIRNDRETVIDAKDVMIGDIFVVRPGESIPVDGTVTEGESAVNESALTGESIPVDKSEGDPVSAGTINQSGFMKCRATRVGADTTLSQIIRMVSDAAATKAPIAKVADRVSGVFVPLVIGIALATFLIWIMTGALLGFALTRAITVLVISCPCALGLATPVAIMVGNGVGAKNGIMFKTSAALEETGRTEVVVLDKTGTITEGEPVVTDIYLPIVDKYYSGDLQDISIEDNNEYERLIRLAASAEKNSEHPLGRAVVSFATERDITLDEVSDFKALVGNGIEAKCGTLDVVAGSFKYMQTVTTLSGKLSEAADRFANQGKTPLVFAEKRDSDITVLGMIAVADVIKKDSAKAISELKDMGIHVVMLTGDNAKTAAAIGVKAGVDEVISDVLPDGKEQVIKKLQENYKVTMVGDGINDAPALTSADIGIAIGAGTDVAIDAADVVLVKSRLSDVPAAIRLSKGTLTNIHENLFWAFFYNALLIPLAAGLYTKLFGWTLSPMIGAAAMSLSSFCVVTNALRLNLLDIRSTKRDSYYKNKLKTLNFDKIELIKSEMIRKGEKELETKTIYVTGMMCEHCEATVKKALEKLDFVESADVSHKKGTAQVTLCGAADDEAIKKAIEDKDYTVDRIA